MCSSFRKIFIDVILRSSLEAYILGRGNLKLCAEDLPERGGEEPVKRCHFSNTLIKEENENKRKLEDITVEKEVEDALKRNKAGTKMTFFFKELNASRRDENVERRKNSSKICSLNRFFVLLLS